MADDRHYIAGQFYRICDQTGFKIRSTNTKKQWNNLIVRKQSWEPRQPQDLVKGIADYQSVPEPRPRPAPNYIDNWTFAKGYNPAGSNVINVYNTTGFIAGNRISIILDNNDTFIVYIGFPSFYLSYDDSGDPIITGDPQAELILISSSGEPAVTPTTLNLQFPLPWVVSNGNHVVDWSSSENKYQNPANYPPSG